jgi:hypothetical protein
MKKTALFLIVMLAAACGAYAFVNTISYSPISDYNATALSFNSDGQGVYSLIGDYEDSGSYNNGFIARLDSSGNSITINTTPNYVFSDGINTPNGYAVLASFYDGNVSASEILHMDAEGNCISVRMLNYADYSAGSICTTPDGGLVAGVDSYGPGQDQLYAVRYDAGGAVVWAKSYNYDAYFYKVVAATDGGFFIAGSLDGSAFVMKTDSSGNKLWDWEDPGYSELWNMLGTENGSVIAVGVAGDTSNEDALIIKIDQTGKQAWRREMDWSLKDYATQINPAAGERLGYVVSGASAGLSAAGYLNLFALQVDGNGNTSNAQNITVPHNVHYGFNAALSANHFILAGIDDLNDIFTADYTPVVYTSVPVPGGKSSDSFYVCPQPATNFVKFVYALQDRATVKINIYNFANRFVGQNVSSELPGDNVTTQVDTTKLCSGVYFYQITAAASGKAEKRLKTGEFIIKK